MFLNFIIKCCEYTTLMKNNPITRILRVYLMTGSLLSVIGITWGFFETDKIRYLTIIIGFLFCVLLGLSLLILFLLQRNLLLEIIDRIIGKHSSYPLTSRNITQEGEKYTEQKSSMEISIFFFSSSICVFCPYLYFITRPGIRLDHPDVQIIPYFYTMWKTDTIFSFMTKKCFEFMSSTASLWVYFIFTIFTIYTVGNLESHVDEINRQLNRIIDANIRKYMINEEYFITRFQKESCWFFDDGRNNKRGLEKSIEHDFLAIIAYFNFIHSYLTDITKFLHQPMTGVFAWYISSTVLFAFSFITATDDFIYIMKMLSLVVHSTVALRLFCNVAEIIYDMNEKIKDSFYNTSWYYLSPKFRKNLSIILALCQRKHNVKCFGMYVVNLNLFIFAVRTVYSAMNILLMMHKK